MTTEVWALPGPRRFARHIANDLAGGRSITVFLPNCCGPERLRGAVHEHLQSRGWKWAEVRASDIFGTADPLPHSLAEALQIESSGSGRISATPLIGAANLSRTTVWIDLRGVSDDDARQWARFVRTHAAAAREIPLTERVAVATIAQASQASGFDVSDVTHSVRWWWGVLSRLDTEVYVAELFEDIETDSIIPATIVEIAAFDIDLADELAAQWDGEPASLPALVKAIRPHDGTPPPASAAGGAYSAEPPTVLRDAWARGLVNRWSELDLCTHSRCMSGDPPRLLRVVWRAQARSLLPLIEIERQRLAAWASATAHRGSTIGSAGEVLDLEIGPLQDLIRMTPALSVDTRRAELAQWLRSARNRLAHLDVLAQSEVSRGRRLIQRAADASLT